MLHSFNVEAMEDCGRDAIALLRRLLAAQAFALSGPAVAAEADRIVSAYDQAHEAEYGKRTRDPRWSVVE